jgi:Tfp pilus assembly protein PilE
MRRRSHKRLRSLRSERGMTVAEVMIAALILAASSLAVLNLIASGAKTNYRAEQSQVVADRLQSEVEQIKQLADNSSYDRIALSSAPTHSTDPNNPDFRVSGSSFNVSPAGSQPQPMVVAPSGIAPTSSFTTGDVDGTVHRYVTWEPDSACSDCLKRVTVAIQLKATASGGVRHYQELQSVIADPRAPERTTDPPPPGPDTKPWTFWLTDTPCNYSDRQLLEQNPPDPGDHKAHNTRASCAVQQVKTADNCSTVLVTTTCTGGPPDLMVTHPPQNDNPEPLFNFATDIVDQNVNQDQGLRLVKPATSGCPSLDSPLSSDSVSPYRFREVHKWVTPPIPSGFNVQLDGDGTLNLWTRTVGNQSSAGSICIWLFQRQVNALGVAVDTPAVNLYAGSPPSGRCVQSGALNLTYFKCSLSSWPSGPKWHEVSIPLHFDLNAIVPDSRLGLALQVERAGTSGGGLQFYYDEPSYESRLELHSSSLLPCDVSPWPSC